MTRALRICLSPGGIDGGGIGMVMLNLAEAFCAQGHQVDLLHIGPSGGRVAPQGCRLVPLGARARHALPAAWRYLRRNRPDLVISARDYINLLMWGTRAALLPGPRPALIWSFHTHHASELEHGARLQDRLAARLMRGLIARPDALVAVSQAVAEGLSRDLGLPPGRISVIENPVWTPARLRTRTAPCPHPWLSGRPLWTDDGAGSRPDPAVILCAGRLVAQKDFPTLIDAFARGPADWRLVILGDGPEAPALRAQITAAGLAARVDMVGHVANALPYMARADLFVLPSRWEGFPMALVEALGCGCPVVASDCPGASAEILEYGRLGHLVPPQDPDALLAAMKAALAAPGAPGQRLEAAHCFNATRASARYLAAAQVAA